MSNSRRIPDFFKVYLPQQSSQRMLIPNAFVTFCNGSLPKNAVLSNHMGSLWPVKVDFTDRGVFFLHGWQEFVRDNSIKCGDFLIFRYDGKCGFSVKIFGNSACERRESGAHRTSCMDKEKLEEEVKEKEEETKENDNDVEDLEDNYDEDDEEEDSTEEEEDDDEEEDSTEEEEAIKKRKVRKQSDGNGGGSKERIPVKVGGGSKRNNFINTQKEEESTIKKSRVRKQSCKNHGGSKSKAVVRVDAEEEVIIKGSRNRKNRRENNEVSEKMPFGKTGRRSKSTSDVRSEGVDVSKYVQPRNPYVIAKMRAGPRKNLLPVPAKILKIWKLKLPNLIWFENERGWQCPGNVISWLDGRFWIGGWHDFCMANLVSPDDYCICEFLQGNNQNKDVIKVQIVRNTGSRS